MESKRFIKSALLSSAISISFMVMPVTQVFADGSNTLGPASVALETGTGMVASGTGMVTQPGSINISIPGSATVKQVLLYWEGVSIAPNLPDDTINIGGIDVIGTAIGSINPAVAEFTAFRADITGLDLVVPGANSLSLTGMDFSEENHGAGLLVIVDDGSEPAELDIRDGEDRAYILSLTADGLVTVPQVFNFAPEAGNRTGELNMFFSSVSGTLSGGGFRPTAIDVTVGGVTTTFDNLLDSNDGEEWDTVTIAVEIPAGESSLTVQAHSVDNLLIGGTPASFSWITAGLTVPVTPPGGGQGCTPGYWKQPHHFDSWVAYTPSQMFSDVFEDAFPGMTLLDVLKQGGGGLKALGRHIVAALLNASNGDVDYDVSAAGIIDSFNAVYPGGDYEGLKDIYADFNEQGCPIN